MGLLGAFTKESGSLIYHRSKNCSEGSWWFILIRSFPIQARAWQGNTGRHQSVFTHCPAQLLVKNYPNVVCSSSVAAEILYSQSGLFYYGSDPGEAAIPQRYISLLFTLPLGFHPAISRLVSVKPKLHLPKALREQPRTPSFPQMSCSKTKVLQTLSLLTTLKHSNNLKIWLQLNKYDDSRKVTAIRRYQNPGEQHQPLQKPPWCLWT